MTSTIKVDNIENQCGGAVVTKCGATTTISGSVVKADDIQAADGGNLINQCGTTITLGASGDTINLASGASQTGFGRTGTVDWQTGSIKTGTFTAVNGEGYFVDTSGGVSTANLPASPSAGDIVAISDYAQNAGTNNITIGRNGSNIQGNASDLLLQRNGVAFTLVYVDATKGWVVTDTGAESDRSPNLDFISATGGTITTSGDYKIHTFTGPGTFCVTNAGAPVGSDTVEYLVVAGGGAGGSRAAGGGGGGGFRFYGACIAAPYPASPLVAPAALPVTAQGYPITVGAGGVGRSPSGSETPGNRGNLSTFSTITSTGGGGGQGAACQPNPLGPGGSGGGGSPASGNPSNPNVPGGSGNTPPVSPPQGNPGGSSGIDYNAGGGGGAINTGSNATPGGSGAGGDGGGFPSAHFGPSGVTCGSFKYYAGGAGGGSWPVSNPGPGGAGGKGGGAAGVAAGDSPSYPSRTANAGTANTGGGGGGAGGGDVGPSPTGPAIVGGSGGSGIVIIRYKFQ